MILPAYIICKGLNGKKTYSINLFIMFSFFDILDKINAIFTE